MSLFCCSRVNKPAGRGSHSGTQAQVVTKINSGHPLRITVLNNGLNIIKIFVRVIKQYIVKFLKDNQLLKEFQHVFRGKGPVQLNLETIITSS